MEGADRLEDPERGEANEGNRSKKQDSTLATCYRAPGLDPSVEDGPGFP